MATNVTVKNNTRTPLRLGTTQIPRDGSTVEVDVDDRRVLRDMYRHIGRWTLVNDAGSSTLSGITASAAEINILDGATVSTAELNLLDGAGAVVASGTQAADIADVVQSSAAVVAADAADQTGSYVEADVDSIATLANANKAEINNLVSDVADLTAAMNDVLAALDAFGITA